MNKTTLTLLTGCLACAAGMVATDQDPGQTRGLTARNSPLQVVEPDAAELNLRMTPVVMAVQKAENSVVSIYIVNENRLTRRGQAQTEGQGSGVILDEAGLVITNWHVVATALAGGQRRVEARLKDGRRIPATIMSSSSDADLALLQLELPRGETVVPVVIGDSGSLMVGETVIAIGNPQGHANTVTQGVLSAVGRDITVHTPDNRVRQYEGLLQTDAAINQGNSGGALLDITGKLIGINNAMAVGSENIGFAIPVDRVRDVFENDLLSSENLTAAWASAWLGVQVKNEGDELVISEVHPLSPAQQAGVRVGDHLVEAGRARVRNTLDYTRSLLEAHAGEPFPLQVQRGDRTIAVRPIPLSFAYGQILDLCGMAVEEITYEQERDLVEEATIAAYEGSGLRRVPLLPVVLRVTAVEPGSPAAELGIQRGDVVLGLVTGNRYDPVIHLESRRDLAGNLQRFRGREVGIWILRNGKELDGELPVRG